MQSHYIPLSIFPFSVVEFFERRESEIGCWTREDIFLLVDFLNCPDNGGPVDRGRERGCIVGRGGSIMGGWWGRRESQFESVFEFTIEHAENGGVVEVLGSTTFMAAWGGMSCGHGATRSGGSSFRGGDGGS